MKAAIRKGIIVVASILFMLSSVWFLGKNNTSIKTSNKKVEHPLHVAVVNEDDGSFYRQKVYQLGRDYINQLKDDSKRDWVTVSRGVAENGLKKDEYQLAIFIPHDFSSKVMDINNPSPDKLNIQYKVNTNNQKDKVECELIAKQMIKDMNQRLVNIYTLNVLGNLYNAQNQVKDIYHRQGNLTNKYNNQLSHPIEEYSQSFPNLYDQSKQALEDNKELANTLKDFNSEYYQNIFNQLGDAKDQVKTLIHDQGQADANQAKIISQLLTMNQKVFDDGLQENMSDMTYENQKLKTLIQQHNQDQSSKIKAIEVLEKQFEDYKKQAQEQIEDLSNQYYVQQSKFQAQVRTLKSMLEQQKDTNATMPQNIQDEIHEKYETGQLTLGDFIKVNHPKLYDALQKQYDNIDSLQRLCSELPFSKLPDHFDKMVSAKDLEEIKRCLEQFEEAKKALNDQGFQVKDNVNNKELEDYQKLYKQYQTAIEEVKNEGIKEITLSNMNYVKGNYFILELPDEVTLIEKELDKFGIQVDSLGEHIYILKVVKDISKLSLPIQFDAEKISYPIEDILLTYIDISKEGVSKDELHSALSSMKDAMNQSDTTTTTVKKESSSIHTTNESTTQLSESTLADSQSEEHKADTTSELSSTSMSDNNMSIDESEGQSSNVETTDSISIGDLKEETWTIHLNLSFEYKPLEKLSNTYIEMKEKLSQWKERYAQFSKLTSERMEQYKNDKIPALLKIDINKPINQLLEELKEQRQSQIQSLIDQLNQEELDEKLSLQKLESNVEQIDIKQLNIVNQIDKQLSSLEQWNKKLSDIYSKQPSNTEVEKQDDEMQQLLSSINDLRKETDDTKKESADYHHSFNNIYDSIHQFGSTVKEVEKDSKGIHKESKELQSDFAKELAKSNDFNKAFIHVLNTAYKDGVPNEQLMEFMAQPLQGKAKYIVNEKTVSYQLFIWILVLSILSWLIASLIISIKDNLYTHYFSKLQTIREKQMIRLIILSICAIISGVLIAYLASQPIPMSHNDLLWWYISIILISLCLSLWCYTSLYYLPIVGTIINFGLLMIYLFNEQYIFHSSLLTAVNILNYFEQLMIDVLLHQSQLFITLFIMADIILLMGMILVIIPKWKGKNDDKN